MVLTIIGVSDKFNIDSTIGHHGSNVIPSNKPWNSNFELPQEFLTLSHSATVILFRWVAGGYGNIGAVLPGIVLGVKT
jgi:hypothetical protein